MSSILPCCSGSIGCDSSPSFFLLYRTKSMIKPANTARPAAVEPAMTPAFAPVDNPSSSSTLSLPVRDDSASLPDVAVSTGALLTVVPGGDVDLMNEAGAEVRVETVIEIMVAVAVALVGLAVPVKPAAE